MRYFELLEAMPDYSLLRRRLNQRITDLWNTAADDPQRVLAEARRLAEWLRSAPITGEPIREFAAVRNTALADLYELIKFLRS